MNLMNFLVGWTHLRKESELEGMKADTSKIGKEKYEQRKNSVKKQM